MPSRERAGKSGGVSLAGGAGAVFGEQLANKRAAKTTAASRNGNGQRPLIIEKPIRWSSKF
jgi:hypothetical protein